MLIFRSFLKLFVFIYIMVFVFHSGFSTTKYDKTYEEASRQCIVDSVVLSRILQTEGVIKGRQIHANLTETEGVEFKQEILPYKFPNHYKVSIKIKNNTGSPLTLCSSDSVVLIMSPHFQLLYPNDSTLFSSKKVGYVASINKRVVTDRLSEKVIKPEKTSDWVGFEERYFAMVLMPRNSTEIIENHSIVSIKEKSDRNLSKELIAPLSIKVPIQHIEAEEEAVHEYILFVGPKTMETLGSGDVSLRGLMFAGLWSWMRWLCIGLLWLMSVINGVVNIWGVSIILLALVIRLVLFPLAQAALKSQHRFNEVQKEMLPELTHIKEKYSGGEQSERIMQLYKKHKVSPFSGLKPLLIVFIQLPILIALLHVLGSAYELKDAPFLWMSTLAEPDRLFSFGLNIPVLGNYFNILPFIMALITMLSFVLSPTPTVNDKSKKTQSIFIISMTVLFFVLFYSFPAGLVLYWTFALVFQILQQKLMDLRLKLKVKSV